uniref:uncharacterized protein LOC122590174 n=1 Tax=Erigeron canadensis TaxID=72917 RepID=UPI001CB9CA97|nr:uncharacterized protein LOC122590174 [Erigeron canadensis]
MKREGRQHGVVSCYQIFPNLSSQQRYAKMVDSASTMGLFAKVPTKPTNQSKFTGKCQKPRCNRCRVHPVCKSKDKAKGTMKYRAIHVENELGKYSFGTSATGVLAYLVDDDGGYGNDHDYDYDYDYDYQDRVEENYEYDHTYDYEYTRDHDLDHRVGFEIEIDDGSLEADADVNDAESDDSETDDDDAMSFCDVGLCWGHEEGEEYGDDGWYLVGGQMQ